METYDIVITVTIDVPQHVDALKAQQEITNCISGMVTEVDYISKIKSKVIEK